MGYCKSPRAKRGRDDEIIPFCSSYLAAQSATRERYHGRISRWLGFGWRTKNVNTQQVAYARSVEIIIEAHLRLRVQTFVHIEICR